MSSRIDRFWTLLAAMAAGMIFLAACSGGTQAGLPWTKDYKAALAAATAESKPVLAYLYTDWCTYCKKLDAETFRSEIVHKEAGKYVWLKLNAETDKDGVMLQKEYSITGYPTVLVLDGKGTKIEQLEGFMPPADFVRVITQAVNGPDSYLALKQKAEKEPQSVDAQYAFGEKLLGQRDYLGAGLAFSRVVELDPENKQGKSALASYGLAHALTSLGRHKEALARLEIIETKYSDSPLVPDVYLLRAHVLENEGKHDESRANLRTYLKKYPDDEKVQLVKEILARSEKEQESVPENPPLSKAH